MPTMTSASSVGTVHGLRGLRQHLELCRRGLLTRVTATSSDETLYYSLPYVRPWVCFVVGVRLDLLQAFALNIARSVSIVAIFLHRLVVVMDFCCNRSGILL